MTETVEQAKVGNDWWEEIYMRKCDVNKDTYYRRQPGIRRLPAKRFDLRGVPGSIASDAETGLSIQNEFRPDLLILDLMLPGMDGIEACKQFRES